jgi:hypothetical protein
LASDLNDLVFCENGVTMQRTEKQATKQLIDSLNADASGESRVSLIVRFAQERAALAACLKGPRIHNQWTGRDYPSRFDQAKDGKEAAFTKANYLVNRELGKFTITPLLDYSVRDAWEIEYAADVSEMQEARVLLRLIEIAQRGQLKFIRRCACKSCGKWFFATRRAARWCPKPSRSKSGPECKELWKRENPAFKAKRRAKAREAREAERKKDERAKQQAARERKAR